MVRMTVHGLGHGLDGDLTTTGAMCIGSLPCSTQCGRMVLRLGDNTTPCPQCGKVGIIAEGEHTMTWHGIQAALDGALIRCGCPSGSNRLIAPAKERDSTSGAAYGSYRAASASSAGKKFAKAFAITDKATGLRMANREFVAQVNGREVRGVTDANGVAIVEAPSADSQIHLHAAFKSPARALTEFSENAQ